MKRLGRKGQEWERTKRQIKPKFEAAGITSCERCHGTYILQWAHARKRRFLFPGELKVVALLCQRCHGQLEMLPHRDMFDQVMAIILARPTQPVEIPATAHRFHLDPEVRDAR